jgi:hypothetical protein
MLPEEATTIAEVLLQLFPNHFPTQEEADTAGFQIWEKLQARGFVLKTQPAPPEPHP